MSYQLQTAKSDTLNGSITSGATSATLTTGSFGSPTGTQLLVLDYDNNSLEVVSCTIAGTALTAITRGLDGTTGVAHSNAAKVIMAFVPSHFTQLGALASSDAWTAFTSSLTGWAATPSQANAYFQVGKLVFFRWNIVGTSNASTKTITLPVAPKVNMTLLVGRVFNNDAPGGSPGYYDLTAASTTCHVFPDGTGGAWSITGGTTLVGTMTYEAN